MMCDREELVSSKTIMIYNENVYKSQDFDRNNNARYEHKLTSIKCIGWTKNDQMHLDMNEKN